jgi:hypothetical protein
MDNLIGKHNIVPVIIAVFSIAMNVLFFIINAKHRKRRLNQDKMTGQKRDIIKFITENNAELIGTLNSIKAYPSSKENLQEVIRKESINRRALIILSENESALHLTRALSYFKDRPKLLPMVLYELSLQNIKGRTGNEWDTTKLMLHELITNSK